ncbi:MAG: RluA family pseudouridine synthase [Xanthomonadales bacterium]|nr:RluA family pseudouridine synthase [Xanthomonadales bacterium]
MKTNRASSSVSHVEVPEDRAGQRLDNFLSARLKGLPRSVIYRIIRTGQVRVNGGRAKPATRLEGGDRVRIPPVAVREGKPGQVPPAVLKLLSEAICFEKHGVLVLDKPAGMAVHGGSGLGWGVIDAVRTMRPGMSVDLVHRLDRETSGCLLLALDRETLRELHEQLATDRIEKRYLCLLDGQLKEDLVEVHEPIGQFQRGGERFMRVDPAGKPAFTTFRLLQPYGDYSFVEATLHTGRTHQIRVHAAHLDLPLVGDKRYSPAARQNFWADKSCKRMFLHAHQLRFFTRDGDEQLVSSRLPDDLRALLDNL